ncbi:MAG: STAS domain-containing protein [Leptospiraceae bacterium]|nr:STAS domain-containing protein [Leptospiraceae bacterium]
MNSDSDYGIEVSKYKNFVMIQFINYQKLDLYNARDLVDIFKVQNESGVEDLVVDMSPIKFIDSSGLGSLATQGIYLSKKNKKLNLISVTSAVAHLFRTSGFEKMFKIYTDKSFL